MKEAKLLQMTGTCHYCGQEVMVEAISEASANIEASKKCKCDNIIKRRANLEQLIDDQCGENAKAYSMEPMPMNTIEFIKNAGLCVLDGDADVCSIKTKESVVIIKRTKQGARCTRKRTQTIQAEI